MRMRLSASRIVVVDNHTAGSLSRIGVVQDVTLPTTHIDPIAITVWPAGLRHRIGPGLLHSVPLLAHHSKVLSVYL
jgi:hypothetical protein